MPLRGRGPSSLGSLPLGAATPLTQRGERMFRLCRRGDTAALRVLPLGRRVSGRLPAASGVDRAGAAARSARRRRPGRAPPGGVGWSPVRAGARDGGGLPALLEAEGPGRWPAGCRARPGGCRRRASGGLPVSSAAVPAQTNFSVAAAARAHVEEEPVGVQVLPLDEDLVRGMRDRPRDPASRVKSLPWRILRDETRRAARPEH